MAILALRKTGGGADFDRLTAVPEDVAAGKRFLGAGSDETQEGTMPVQGSPSIMLPANGSVTLPAGKYTGGKVSQQIATMGEQSIGPGAKQITINCAGKYMTGNIIIRPTKNLIISNIKKNQYVGGVGPGIWEGYVNDDPLTPYLYGTFYGNQGITSMRYTTYRQGTGKVSLSKDHIAASAGSGETIAYVFDLPIRLDGVKSLTVEMSGTGKTAKVLVCRGRATGYIEMVTQSGSSLKYEYNPALGDLLLDGTIGRSSAGGDIWNQQKTFGLSGFTGNAYLYIGASSPAFSYDLYFAKFNT